MTEPKRLTDEDWADLFPGEVVNVGKTALEVKPFSIEDIARIGRLWKALSQKHDMDLETLAADPARLVAIIPEEGAELLEMATGLHRDDLNQLPAGKYMELVAAVVRVNVECRDGLVKNFRGLVEAAKALTGGALGTSPNTSSDMATPGQPSESTTSPKSVSSSAPAVEKTKTGTDAKS